MIFKKLLVCTSLMVTGVCFAEKEDSEKFICTKVVYSQVIKELAFLQEKTDKLELMYKEKCTLHETNTEICKICHGIKESINLSNEFKKEVRELYAPFMGSDKWVDKSILDNVTECHNLIQSLDEEIELFAQDIIDATQKTN